MAINPIERFGQKWYAWWRNTKQTFLQKFLSKYLQWDLSFHFSHCKSMETKLPQQPKCLSNGNKNNIFVEAIVRNNSAKFQIYPQNSFWRVDFWIFFSQILPFGCHGNQPN